MKYYELKDDVYYPERWYLGDIKNIENHWQFIAGYPIDEASLPRDLQMEIYQMGRPMDYTTSEAYGVPIVSQSIKNLLADTKNLQFVPIRINSSENDEIYYIMVVTKKIACVNENLSVFEKFVDNDPIRPDKAGHYSWFSNLVVDPFRVIGEDVFRIDKTAGYLIINERIKSLFVSNGITGAKFAKV